MWIGGWQLAALGLGWLVAGVLGLLLWSSRSQRQTRVAADEVADQVADLATIIPSLQALTEAWSVPGNRIQFFENGAGFYPELLRQIEAAESSIHLELYAWWQGDICRRVANALATRARDGIEVRVIVDALGSVSMETSQRSQLKDAGVQFVAYHDFRFRTFGRLNKRDHRKLAVFDGRRGLIFGHGIAEEWEGDGDKPGSWRDLGARVEGPVVLRMQAVFAQNWMEETGGLLSSEKYFPHVEPLQLGPDEEPDDDVTMQVVSSSPRGGVSNSSVLLRLLIAGARDELVIQNPYFAPGREVIELLGLAARNGVRVRVLVPGEHIDADIVRYAGHYFFSQLLQSGVELYEFLPTLNHQKIVIVDGRWTYLGSANFDERSFDINAECGLVLHGPKPARQLLEIFEKDLQRARRLDPEQWQRRGLVRKVKERLSFLFHDQI